MQKYDKRKVTICLYGGSKPPPYAQNPSIANRKSKKYVLYPVSAGTGATPAHLIMRACRLACTNLLGYLVRCVCTRGIDEAVGSYKTANFYIASVSHALATHGSCE